MITELFDRIFRPLKEAATPPELAALGVEFHDRRAFAMQAHGPKRQWKVRRRAMKRVTGQCWHQAGCDLGEQVERYDSVGAHVCITRGRGGRIKVIWLHDWDHLGMFANDWNDGTVSIEVSGLYAGIKGKLETVWDNPATPAREMPVEATPELLAVGVAVGRWIHRDVNARGGKMRVVVSHRQSSGSRQSDPGQELYAGIVIPLAEELGLDRAPNFTLDDGRRVPEEWDPKQKGVRY